MKLADAPTFQSITGPSPIKDVQGIENLISTGVGLLTIVGGIIFLIWFMIGAINWISSGGKPDKLEAARNHMTNAITGLIILIAAFALTGIIGLLFGINFFNLAEIVNNLQL